MISNDIKFVISFTIFTFLGFSIIVSINRYYVKLEKNRHEEFIKMLELDIINSKLKRDSLLNQNLKLCNEKAIIPVPDFEFYYDTTK